MTPDGEFNVANPATPTLLFHLAASTQYPPDLEDFCGLTSVALAYLTSEPFQVQLVSTRCFELLQLVFYHSLTRFHLATADPDHAAQLKQVWNVFVNMFADISALPVFPVLYPIRSPAVRRLVSWLANVPSSLAHLQTAACLALGNLSRSDESSRSLLADVYPPLCRILSQAVVNTSTPAAPSAQLLHAALSFLKNLAIPVVNKPVMGHLLEPPLSILPQIWSMTDTQPDTQFVAVSLTRLALTDCAANVARFCAPLSPDTSSPAHARSNVHKLIDLSQRADAEPTKIEAGRAIATVCRMLHTAPIDAVLPVGWDDYEIPDPASAQASTPIHLGYMSSPGSLPALSPSSASDSHSNNSRRSSSSHSSARPSATAAAAAADPLVQRRVRFYHAHAQMYKPLRGLLTQRAWPGVRSEALFVLALMSRTREGMDVGAAQAVSGPDALRALSEAVTGRDMIDGRELGGGGAAAARVAEQAGMLEGFGYSTAVSMMVGGGGGRPEAMEGVSREVGDMVQGLGLEPRQADPARSAGLRRVDRENGLVLVAEMLKQQGATMPSFQRNAFEEILAGGSEMVLGERSGLQA